MADQVVTELVIDADTSGADRFSQAMDQAGQSAQSGMSSVQGMTLAIAGVGVATIAAIAGLRSFIDMVGNQSQTLVDMANHAELAGMSVKQFQETLFAAMSGGVSEKDFTSGIDRIASDLTDASRGATQFGKLMEANGIAIKDANGQLVTTKQALSDIANLMQQATPQQQQAIAKIVGLSQSWIPFLKQGADAIEEQKQKAADLGIIIDDSTIAKAKEFNAQWHTAVAAWDLQFKASMASILPLLTQLATLASKVIDGIGGISGTAIRLMTPVDQQTTAQLNDTINDMQRLTEVMQKFGEQSFRATNLKGALGLPEDADLKQVFASLDKIIAQYDALNGRIHVTAQAGTGINLPALNDTKDAFERAIDAVKRHTDQIAADADAVGLGAGALAKFKAEAQLVSAAESAGITVTDAMREKIKELSEAAADAATDLAKVQVASQIEFDQKTAFLSSEDVKIAQQLKVIYGNDIPAALASTEAGAIRFNDRMKDVRATAEQIASTFAVDFVGAIASGQNAVQALTASISNLGKSLVNAGINNIIKDPTNPVGYIEAGVGALAEWFGGQSEAQKKAEEELRQAQENWRKMADQVTAFNQAAAGLDLGPITQGIQSLFNSYTQLAEAANKAKEYAAVAQLQATFNLGLNRLVNSFIDGTPVMTDLQKQMKAVMDEGQGMIETLISLGAATDATVRAIQDSINRQQSDLQRKFIADTEAALLADVRNNAGLGYLNTIGDAIKKFNSDISQGISGGVASAWLYSTAQAAVDSAKLTGSAFQDMLALFPDLTGKIHEFVDTTALAAKAAADATQKLSLQLRLLSATTDTSTLSGALALFDAKAKQERDAALAGGITPDNLLLLDQALAAERLNVIKGFTDQAVAAEKQLADQRLAQMQRIQQYLDNLTAGPSSTLAPVDRLAAAQSQFTSQLSAARGGDQNAIQNITSYSDNLLQAARDYYASSQGYQDIFQQVQSSLAGLIATGLISGTSGSGLPGTTGTTPIGSVSGSISAPAAANTNSISAVVAVLNDISGKVVVLQTKLDNINSSIDAGNQSNANGFVDEGKKLDQIVENTGKIGAASPMALAATR